jgi:hypothetical protein
MAHPKPRATINYQIEFWYFGYDGQKFGLAVDIMET